MKKYISGGKGAPDHGWSPFSQKLYKRDKGDQINPKTYYASRQATAKILKFCTHGNCHCHYLIVGFGMCLHSFYLAELWFGFSNGCTSAERVLFKSLSVRKGISL